MDWYSIVKFLHVTSAILWLGGGFVLVLLAVRAERSGDPQALMLNIRNTAALGMVLFMPASLATLLTGIMLAALWTGFSDLWIMIGLGGAAATFLTGLLFIKPVGDRLNAMVAQNGVTPAVLEEGRKLLRIAKFDYTVMIVIIADMVLKPTASDPAILGAMGALIVAGALLFLVPRRETPPIAA
jgi:uncharacterized membrane protein